MPGLGKFHGRDGDMFPARLFSLRIFVKMMLADGVSIHFYFKAILINVKD
jgi:hypothetical protein